MTRLVIAFVFQVLRQYVHSPKQSHKEVVLRVVRCIKEIIGLGLFMPSKKCSELVASQIWELVWKPGDQ